MVRSIQFSFLCFSEDSFLLHTEKTLRGFLLKINACDALLQPIPSGKSRRHISFFCETFFASSNISRAPTRLEYHADVQCTLISSSVEIKNRGVYHLNISHCLFFDRMYVLHSCIYQRIVVLKTTGGPQGSGVLRALMAML